MESRRAQRYFERHTANRSVRSFAISPEDFCLTLKIIEKDACSSGFDEAPATTGPHKSTGKSQS